MGGQKKAGANLPATVARMKNTITANGGIVALDVYGEGFFAVQITGDAVATLQFEGSVDGVTFSAINLTPVSGGPTVNNTTTTGIWRGGVAGLNTVRVRASAYTSGTATVILQSSPNGSVSLPAPKGVPTETTVTGSGSSTLVAAGVRQSARATVVSGSAWVSRATPAATAAPARLMGAGDVLYDSETIAAWYYTAVGSVTFSVEVIV